MPSFQLRVSVTRGSYGAAFKDRALKTKHRAVQGLELYGSRTRE